MDGLNAKEMTVEQAKAIGYEYSTPTCAICRCTEETPCYHDYPCFWVTINRETNVGICSACLGF